MIPAGIYLRVSTDEQNTEVQLPALERMAAARGYEVTQIYRDAAIGGTKGKLERPELARVFADASRGRIRAVFVWALDRFSRDDSFIGGVLMIGELDHYRCALISSRHGPEGDRFGHERELPEVRRPDRRQADRSSLLQLRHARPTVRAQRCVQRLPNREADRAPLLGGLALRRLRGAQVKGTDLYKDELRERREQLERLCPAREAWEREVKRAQRWDRMWMRWTSAVGVAIGLAVLAFELYREWVIWTR